MYFIRESHTSQLLKRKVVAIQSHRADLILRTAPTPPPSIIQPLILLVTKPTVFLSSLTNAFRTALLYLFAVAFPLIYTHYTWSRQKTTLIFLFIVPGLLLSTLTQLHTHHKIRKYRLAKRRPNPSTYLFNLFIGAPALAIALWWFAWTIPSAHVNSIGWPASAVSLILLGCGINAHSTALPLYVLAPSRKSAHDDAAIASASFTAMLVTKALLCAVFPLFTQEMFENLGNNVAGSVLAAVATVFCVIPFILFRFGEKWRGGSGVGSSSGGMDDDEEVKMEEKRSKPKKTVRWGDEMDSSSGSDGSSEQTSQSDTHISESASVSGSSELSRTETETDTVTETEADTSGGPSSSEVPALSRSKTHISTRDFATVTTTETPHHTQTENEIENRNEVSPPLSKVSTQQDSTQPSSRSSSSSTSDPPHTASDTTTSVRTETGTSSNSSNSSGRADGKKEKAKKRKEETRREDDMDNGRAGGLWGMDLERMAVLPYF